MAALKKPEMILGLVNAAGLVGVTVYFSKQLSTHHQKLTELTEKLAQTIIELENSKRALIVAINGVEEIKAKLHNTVQDLARNCKDKFGTLDETNTKNSKTVDDIKVDITSIAEILKDAGYDIKLRSQGALPVDNAPPVSKKKKNTKHKTSGESAASGKSKPKIDDSDTSDDDHASSVRRKRRS